MKKEVTQLDAKTILENKRMFINRFIFLAEHAEAIYSLLETPFIKNKNEIYELIETILFDNDMEKYHEVVENMERFKQKIHITAYDSDINYTSLILRDMYLIVSNYKMPTSLKCKKVNMLIQYNNLFTPDCAYELIGEPLSEQSEYNIICENEFINTMANRQINQTELDQLIFEKKEEVYRKTR